MASLEEGTDSQSARQPDSQSVSQRGNCSCVPQDSAPRPLPGVDLVDGDVEASGDVLDGLVALGDDAHALGDGLGRDWMVTGDHDDLRKEIER